MSAAEQVEQADVKALWLTYPEAQKLAGLGRTTLWTLVSSGEIKAARVGSEDQPRFSPRVHGAADRRWLRGMT
jgi:excisionase family DNA binding protein